MLFYMPQCVYKCVYSNYMQKGKERKKEIESGTDDIDVLGFNEHLKYAKTQFFDVSLD